MRRQRLRERAENRVFRLSDPHKLVIGRFMKSILIQNVYHTRWPVISKEIQGDHIHLFLSIPPATAISNVVKILKGANARKLFLMFLDLKNLFWSGIPSSLSYTSAQLDALQASFVAAYTLVVPVLLPPKRSAPIA